MHGLKLYMLLIGGRPKGRLTEQHDIYFGIGKELKDLIPHIKLFWSEVKNNFHIDAWREVTKVNNYEISIAEKNIEASDLKLFFMNLGGYKENEFEEFHYKSLFVGNTLGDATQQAKQTEFYKTTGFKGATSHIDDKYAIDVDDAFAVEDILSDHFRNNYSIKIIQAKTQAEDTLH
ncbi:MAG: DUF1543 domain-containing protein [Bacteroidetes bacterium]|nr:DUF1543 domain-containing protein [Bacteroidota bacterium]